METLGLDFRNIQLTIAVLKANEYYHSNSTLGEFLPFIGLGSKILC